MRFMAVFVLLVACAFTAAEEVEQGSLQAQQAQKYMTALGAAPTPCSEALIVSENTFRCATFARDASSFRIVIDSVSAASNLNPVGPWASYQGEEGQQRSFLYKDGFMTVSYFSLKAAPKTDLMVVQYVIPHD